MTVTYIFQASNRETRGLPPVSPHAPTRTDPEPPPLPEGVTPFSRGLQPMPDATRETGMAEGPAPFQTGKPLRLVDPLPASAPVPPVATDPDPAAAPHPVAVQPQDDAVPVNLPVAWTPVGGKLILVAKSRGGLGASSFAVNLAVALQKRGGTFFSSSTRRVALVDFDIQFGTIASALDLEDRGGMLGMARLPEEPDAQAVRNTLLSHGSGLRVLPAPRNAIPLDALDRQRVESIISALLAEHEIVVVELPPALVPWIEPLLERAHRLLMVTDLSVPSVERARRMIDLMREDNPQLPVEILVARERKPFLAGRLQKEAEAALGVPLAHWLPDEPKLSRQALDRGEPLVEMASRCPWSRAVGKVAQSLDRSVGVAPTKGKG